MLRKFKYMIMSRDQNAVQNHDMKTDNKLFEKGGIVQIFGNSFHVYKLYSERNEEQIEVKECLLSFDSESFVFQFAIQKYKD